MLTSRRPTKTLAILTATTTTNTRGDTVENWDTPGTADAKGYIDQQTRTEDLRFRDAEVGEWIGVFVDPAAPVTAANRVQDGDRVFRVTGTPWVVETLAGPHHLECTLSFLDG